MADDCSWTLSKIDLRSPVMANAWPVARLELIHPVRGRVTDIGKAPGAFDAAFIAAGHILGIDPRLLSCQSASKRDPLSARKRDPLASCG